MVGTAVYQVGCNSSSQPKNFSALNPGVQNTLPPAAIEESTAAIRPWIWNSGMMLRQRSAGVSARVRPICVAEASTFRWDSGTSFGREVVPEVCSSSATSSGPEKAGSPLPAAVFRRNDPAAVASGRSSMMETPSAPAAWRAGLLHTCLHHQGLGLQIPEIEVEFIGPVGGVQRRRGRAGADGQEGASHVRPVGQYDRHPVLAADPAGIECTHRALGELAEGAVAQRRPVRAEDGRGAGRLAAEQLNQRHHVLSTDTPLGSRSLLLR